MGVHAPGGVTKAYYFAYEIGLFISFFTYWAACYVSPPKLTVPLSEWREPRDYVRPEERGVLLEGREGDLENESERGEGKKEAVGGVNAVRSEVALGFFKLDVAIIVF